MNLNESLEKLKLWMKNGHAPQEDVPNLANGGTSGYRPVSSRSESDIFNTTANKTVHSGKTGITGWLPRGRRTKKNASTYTQPDMNGQQGTGYPYGNYAQNPGETGFNPYNMPPMNTVYGRQDQYFDPNNGQQGMYTDPNAQYADPNMYQPNAQYADPNMYQPNAQYADPNAYQQNAQYADPNAYQPNAQYADPNAYKQNAQYADPNVYQPNAQYADPNAYQQNPDQAYYDAQQVQGTQYRQPDPRDPYGYQANQNSPYSNGQAGYFDQQSRSSVNSAPVQNGYTPAASTQQPQQQEQPKQDNVVPIRPNLWNGPDGRQYAHVERVTQLRSVQECFRIIEFMRNCEGVIVNTEAIASEQDVQRCLDMLSGAAFTLGCTITKITQVKRAYLIAPNTVLVMPDQIVKHWSDRTEAQAADQAQRDPSQLQRPSFYEQGVPSAYARPSVFGSKRSI